MDFMEQILWLAAHHFSFRYWKLAGTVTKKNPVYFPTFWIYNIKHDLVRSLGRGSKKMENWKFNIAFAIGRRTPPPPPSHKFPDFFLPHFISLQLNPTYMKWILHLVSLRNIVLKSSYNWFKYRHSLAVLAADCQLFSHVHSHLISRAIYT